MKSIKIFVGLILMMAVAFCMDSCGKGSQSPVDEYVAILDEAAEKAEKISSMQDLLNVHEIISPEAAMNVANNNADYVLSKSDKEKLKKSYDKLLKVAYEKTAEYGGLPQDVMKQTKNQINLFIEAANDRIDGSQTLGELVGIR